LLFVPVEESPSLFRMTQAKEEIMMERSRWMKAGVGLGALLMTLTLGCATRQRPALQITDTWTESAQRAETAAGRAEAAASRAETSADRVEAVAKRIEDMAARVEARTMQRMRK
jgi:hypothetical protein